MNGGRTRTYVIEGRQKLGSILGAHNDMPAYLVKF